MLLSLCGVLPATLVWIPANEVDLSHGHGWRNLSLPVDMAVEPDWLNGWESIRRKPVADPADDQLDPDPRVDPAGAEQKVEFRIHLYGILDENPDSMYCFFDTEQERWFRLVCGQADTVSGVKVSTSDVGPVVQDTRTGSTYLIESDNYLLCKVD